MKYAILLIAVFTVASVSAGSDKSTGGFAAHLGFGSLYGGSGASVEYQVLLSQRWRLSPFIAAGLTAPIYGGDRIYRFGYCVGVNAEYGRLHRFFFGPSFGSQYLDYDKDSLDNFSNVNTVVGPAMVAGYKGTARFGLMWLVFGGVCYILNDKHPEHNNGIAPAFGLGLGYKF